MESGYNFYKSSRGLIRQRGHQHPEVFRNGSWVPGSPYVVDAITGMGEDPWSCGEWADEITKQEAAILANRMPDSSPE